MTDLCGLVKEKWGFTLSDRVNSTISGYQEGMELCASCGKFGELKLCKAGEGKPTRIFIRDDDSYGLCEDCRPASKKKNRCDSCGAVSDVSECRGWDGEGCRYDIFYCPECPWTICNQCEDPGLRGEPESEVSDSEEVEEDSGDREFLESEKDSEEEIPTHKKKRIVEIDSDDEVLTFKKRRIE